MKNCLRLMLLVMGGIFIWYCGSVKTTSKINSLVLQNIEALAEDESFDSVDCFGVGSIDCPKDNSKVAYVVSGYGL